MLNNTAYDNSLKEANTCDIYMSSWMDNINESTRYKTYKV